MNKREISEIERVASCIKCLNIPIDMNADNLCLEIQDKIRKLSNEFNKTKHILKVYKSKCDGQTNTHSVKAEDVKNTYKNENLRLIKLNNELMNVIDGLKLELEKYKRDRINNVICGNVSDFKVKEYLL